MVMATTNQHEAQLELWLAAHPKAPIVEQLVVRLFAGAYSKTPLPSAIKTPRHAVQWAKQFAAEHEHPVCLFLAPQLRLFIDRDGSIECLQEEDD
jgi:hypothetical protein